MKLEDYLKVTFESSTGKTPQFKAFSRLYRARVKKTLGPRFEIINWTNGHFYCSAFARNRLTGNFVYISCPDVRHFPLAWWDDVLIRSAEHERDYTGGMNRYTNLDSLGELAERITP